jgi:hypothetical protein
LNAEALLKSLVRDSTRIAVKGQGTYDISYPEFLLYFRTAAKLTRHHVIIGANFSYDWMPTILDFWSDRFEQAVHYLERARGHTDLNADELGDLAALVNNSIRRRLKVASLRGSGLFRDLGPASCQLLRDKSQKPPCRSRTVSRIRRLLPYTRDFLAGH